MTTPRTRKPRPRAALCLALLAALLLPTACHIAQSATSEPEVPGLFELAVQLAPRRHANIERLRAYREAGVYPRNRVLPGQANVFTDEDGHLCAVANLMWQDGETDLVRQTARDHNLVVLRDVHEGPLYDWILSSGLTQAEIARIQEPYFRVDPNDPNFEQVEDQRLNDHFVQVDQELQQNDTWALLQAARAQREAIVAQSRAN